jgi:hypothetical protein
MGMVIRHHIVWNIDSIPFMIIERMPHNLPHPQHIKVNKCVYLASKHPSQVYYVATKNRVPMKQYIYYPITRLHLKQLYVGNVMCISLYMQVVKLKTKLFYNVCIILLFAHICTIVNIELTEAHVPM